MSVIDPKRTFRKVGKRTKFSNYKDNCSLAPFPPVTLLSITACITDLITKCKEAVAIDKPGSCTYSAMAAHMLENGYGYPLYPDVTGHVNLSSTEIYTQISIRKFEQIDVSAHLENYCLSVDWKIKNLHTRILDGLDYK